MIFGRPSAFAAQHFVDRPNETPSLCKWLAPRRLLLFKIDVKYIRLSITLPIVLGSYCQVSVLGPDLESDKIEL